MIKNIEKFGFLGWLLLIGFIFVLAGYFKIDDITKLRIEILPQPNYVVLGLGVLFILVSVGLFAYFKKLSFEIRENLTKTAESIKERRFANLVYIFAKDTQSIAMGLHKGLGVHLPPGGRLEVYEMPHENVLRIIRDQIGLRLDFNNFVSLIEIDSFEVTDGYGQRIGETEYCPSPVWAQLEKHTQRPDHTDESQVKEHFDFIFLCVIEKEVLLRGGVREDTGWFSLNEVEEMKTGRTGRRTFVDVYEGFRAIKKIMENIPLDNKSMRPTQKQRG